MNTNTNIPEFGIKRENEERRDGGSGIVFDPQSKKYAIGKHHEDGSLRLFSGGVSEDEDIQEGIIREVTEESGLYDFQYVEKIDEALTHYCNPLRKVNRVAHATCFLLILKSTKIKSVELEEHEKFSLEWATADDILADWRIRNQNRDNDHWIYFMEKSIKRIKELGFDVS